MINIVFGVSRGQEISHARHFISDYSDNCPPSLLNLNAPLPNPHCLPGPSDP